MAIGYLDVGRTQLSAPEETHRDGSDNLRTGAIWRSGLVCFRLLTGTWPFDLGSNIRNSESIFPIFDFRDAPFSKLTELRPELPRELTHLIDGCLQHSPADRPSLEELSVKFTMLRYEFGGRDHIAGFLRGHFRDEIETTELCCEQVALLELPGMQLPSVDLEGAVRRRRQVPPFTPQPEPTWRDRVRRLFR